MKYVDQELKTAGWSLDDIRREYPITKGKITPEGRSGKRGSMLKADYILQVAPTHNIAVIEVKSSDKEASDGIQQALEYAKKLELKFAYATNGKSIIEYDGITNKQKEIDAFPTKNELIDRYKKDLGLDEKKFEVLVTPLTRQLRDPAGKVMEPRYYQEIAINAATKAILAGKKRILLTLATGTGKTFIAFQIAYRLWKTTTPRPKILFLADRDVLLNQAMNNAFAEFRDARHRIQRKVNTAFDMYFALYQALDVSKEDTDLYELYPNDFFDYVIVDECHRGSSTEGGEWRKILDHFNSAIHIGMTATPKRDEDSKDTYNYFGSPVYSYSLKQGIEDGFLAPYIIHQVHLNIDQTGYTPKPNETDSKGNKLEQKTYWLKDFDRNIAVKSRRVAVARHLIRFMEQNHAKYDKTIVFCQDSEHAAAMTGYLRSFCDEGYDYAVRIVSAEGEIGKEYLDKFQTPNIKKPVIAVTSKLISTGVDVPTCRIIVFDKSVNSMTEFKQIIGRGTRVFESKDKMWFTILDYRNVSRLFLDEEWDGQPVKIIDEEEENGGTDVAPTGKGKGKGKKDNESDGLPPKKFFVDGQHVVINGESVMIFDESMNKNRLISYTDYTGERVRRIVNDNETELHKIWTNPESRKHFINELNKVGVSFKHLKEITQLYEQDSFDLLLHFAFNSSLKTRIQRVDNIRKKSFLEKYPDKARAVLEVILDHYAEQGYQELEGREILNLPKFQRFGGPSHIIEERFNGQYDSVINEIIKQLYIHN